MSAIGIDRISSPVCRVYKKKIAGIFDIDETEFNSPDEGEIDMLIGLQYAVFHPVPVSTSGHLILYRNCFGTVLGGCHSDIHEDIQIH